MVVKNYFFLLVELPTDANISNSSLSYPNYEHKIIMILGMMASDFPLGQSRIGDKGGIEFIVESLKKRTEDAKIVLWSNWSLVVFNDIYIKKF